MIGDEDETDNVSPHNLGTEMIKQLKCFFGSHSTPARHLIADVYDIRVQCEYCPTCERLQNIIALDCNISYGSDFVNLLDERFHDIPPIPNFKDILHAANRGTNLVLR